MNQTSKPKNKKTDYLAIRISSQVKSILEQKASKMGMNMSEYARLLILEDARKDMHSTETE